MQAAGGIAWLVAVCAAFGCIDSATTTCADGTVCPEGKVCSPGGGSSCVDPEGLIVPEGRFELGDVGCGATQQRTLTLANLDPTPISFVAQSTDDRLTLDPEQATIPAGETLDVTVSVSARADEQEPGQFEAGISFETDSELISRIVVFEVAGAIVRPSQSVVDFGITTLALPPGPATFTIHNDGNAAIDMTLSDPGGPFSIDDPGPIEIPGGGSRDVAVSFSPTANGESSGSINMSFNGALCAPPPTTLSVSGMISDADLLIDTTNVDYGITGCSVTADSRTITLTNNTPVSQAFNFEITGPDAADFLTPNGVAVAGNQTQQPVNLERLAIGVPTVPGAKSATLEITASPSTETILVDLAHTVNGPFLQPMPAILSFTPPPFSIGFMDVNVSNVQGTASAMVSANPTQSTIGTTVLTVTTSINPVSAGAVKKFQVNVFVEDPVNPVFNHAITFNASNNCNGPSSVTVNVSP